MTVEQWLDNNPIAVKIWYTKYRNGDETFEQWLDRVSGFNPKIRQLILDKKFLFGGRTLANRGLNNGSYANCYSHGFIGDTLEEIMQANTDLALTYRVHGGQGLSVSKIRPKGAPIGNRYQSDGIIPFMKLFNQTTDTISQGGSRKGALMMSCDVWHKQIEDFITVKSVEGAIEKANLSVEIDDEFMSMVDRYIEHGEHPIKHIVRDYNGHIVEYDVDVAKIYDLICDNALKHAEPGIIFTNKFRHYNLMQYVPGYNIETSNPCGEQPLPPHGACNLCSINLLRYVANPFTDKAKMDWDELRKDLFTIIGVMDDLIDENYPNHALKEQAEMSRKYRNIGIGFMGFADMLIALRLRYDSNEAIKMAHKVAKFMFKTSVYASAKLGEYRGNFPGYDPMIWKSEIIRENFTDEEIIELSKHNRLRNCSLLSIAPTGLD